MAFQKNPAHIQRVTADNPVIEARGIATQIEKRRHVHGVESTAVLVRMHRQMLPLQMEFVRCNLEYRLEGKSETLGKHVALRDVLQILRTNQAVDRHDVVTPQDAAGVIQSIYDIRDVRQMETIQTFFGEHRDFLSALRTQEFRRLVPQADGRQLTLLFQRLQQSEGLASKLALIDAEFRSGQHRPGIVEDLADDVSPLYEILIVAAAYHNNTNAFVDDLTQLTRLAVARGAGAAEDGVELLTYFKAKGRQWHTVYLASTNADVIPHVKSPVEDERRLFYVGMTRVAARLKISWVRQMASNEMKPSPFLRESGLLPS